MVTSKKNTIFDLVDVSELTVDVLEACLEFSGMLKADQNAREIAEYYFDNSDHGFSHSQAVWNRCIEIIHLSPLLWRKCQAEASHCHIRPEMILILASIFHDMGRFIGAPFETHELVGANLASKIISNSGLEWPLHCAIVHHDYISCLVDNIEMPAEIMHPCSEIFRLADKTSISPAEEIKRYHATGRRYAPDLPLFNPNIPDEERFVFRRETIKRDEFCWMLIIFALQSTDFLYAETRESYAYWARGKLEAVEEICELSLVDEYFDGQSFDTDEIRQTISRFCKKFELIITA